MRLDTSLMDKATTARQLHQARETRETRHAHSVHQPYPPRLAEPAAQPERRVRQDWQLAVSWADNAAQVREAQALRYRVFVLEMGARLTPPTGTAPNLDADRFDPFCDHLLVYASQGGRRTGTRLVGTYRLLSPASARAAGGFYMDTEFDLAPLVALRAHAVELGRSCVDPAWRSGAVIMMLWSALGDYMRTHRLQTMIGCASIPLKANLHDVASLWQELRQTHLASPQWQVQPHVGLSAEQNATTRDAPIPGWPYPAAASAVESGRLALPPLIKGYLRCGARLLGPPALDLDFNTADLPMMLQVEDLVPRYRRHFLAQ